MEESVKLSHDNCPVSRYESSYQEGAALRDLTAVWGREIVPRFDCASQFRIEGLRLISWEA